MKGEAPSKETAPAPVGPQVGAAATSASLKAGIDLVNGGSNGGLLGAVSCPASILG
jgi:hypothetical protein